MIQVLGEVLPLAVAVLISPLPIAAEIILLFTSQPKANASAYVGGFVVGVGVVLGLLTVLVGTQDLGGSSGPATWVSWLKIVLGTLLVVGGIRRLRNRPAPGDTEAPKWMQGIESFTPGRSLAVGFAIGALNPKNLAVGLAAAVAVAGSGLAGGTQVGVVVVYAVFASLGVLAPLVVTIALGPRSEEILTGWRTWLMDNNTAVMAVMLVVIGAVVIGKGVAAL